MTVLNSVWDRRSIYVCTMFSGNTIAGVMAYNKGRILPLCNQNKNQIVINVIIYVVNMTSAKKRLQMRPGACSIIRVYQTGLLLVNLTHSQLCSIKDIQAQFLWHFVLQN